jgi:hypothetical protein
MCVYTYGPTYVPSPTALPNVYPAIFPTYTGTTYVCNHCWCQDALNKPNHVQCCKCFDNMADRFVPDRLRERRDRETAALIAKVMTRD